MGSRSTDEETVSTSSLGGTGIGIASIKGGSEEVSGILGGGKGASGV